MSNRIFPRTIVGFTEYIKIAYAKAKDNLSLYGIAAAKLSPVTATYSAYIKAEAIAANPDTATTGARHARDDARKALEPVWRKFLNENIRYNSAVPVADLEVFGIKERDPVHTPVGVPDVPPILSIHQKGVRRLEIEVLNSETGKKKKPQYATGSYVYLAITEPGQEPKHESEFRKLDFSSNCHHVIEFPLEQLAKQANIYARYSNAHGKEGPEGITEAVIIA
ncbi:MAG: hypothetical protein LBP87_09620 [Planctomycetaceae bacterium]|jgi:hypothetical protein|nr:hypothetical protein [Planctomycetaceae bacterium]